MEPERGQPEPEPLAPPGDLRPAQMGVLVNFRLTLGHLGASLIDLKQRGALGAEVTEGSDWTLTDRRGPGTPKPAYEYESQLLDSLFAGPSPLRLSELTADTVRGLGQVETLLLNDLRRWHWLSSVGDDMPHITSRGRDARQHVYAFRRELTSQFWAGRDVAALTPYVTAFQLASGPDPLTAAWLAACDRFRDPEYTKPGRAVADEPVRVFYLNWVSPPGYQRFHQYEYLGDEAADQHRWGPARSSRPIRMRLGQWRAAWRASRRD